MVILCGGCDGFVGQVLDGRVEELAADVLEEPQALGGHGEASPSSAGPVEDGPGEGDAGGFAGKAADHLDAPAGLAEGPLDEVGVADPAPVLGREAQVDGEV